MRSGWGAHGDRSTVAAEVEECQGLGRAEEPERDRAQIFDCSWENGADLCERSYYSMPCHVVLGTDSPQPLSEDLMSFTNTAERPSSSVVRRDAKVYRCGQWCPGSGTPAILHTCTICTPASPGHRHEAGCEVRLLGGRYARLEKRPCQAYPACLIHSCPSGSLG